MIVNIDEIEKVQKDMQEMHLHIFFSKLVCHVYYLLVNKVCYVY